MDYFERIQNAVDYIEDHLLENITLIDIAKQAYYSHFHFHRIFNILAGQPVMGYLRKRRLARSLGDLEEGSLNILETAIKYQFKSHDSYTRAFKREYEITPKEYRKSVKLL